LINDFKATIIMNPIKNNPVTSEDVKISEMIFGPDIGRVKGKTTRIKPNPVVSDYIDIPQELIEKQQDIILCIRTMFINWIAFFTTISCNIMLRNAEPINNQGKEEYVRVMKNLLQIYKNAGFKVTRIHADNEFKSIAKEFNTSYNLTFKFTSANKHVPEAERNNRLIKERVRALFHHIPYTKLPRLMIHILFMESTKKLNNFPPKGGTSKYFNPRMIMTKEMLDYEKHCNITFGMHVQAHEENKPTYSLKARAIDGIYLRLFVSNTQEGHEIMNLSTGQIIRRRKVSIVPMMT
jgi:hypothetical protein